MLIGLDRYGLTVASLRRLGERAVRLSIGLKGLSYGPLFRYPPEERRRRLRAALESQKRRLMRSFSDANLRSRGGLGWTLDGRLVARQVHALAKRPEVRSLFLDKIEGLRPRKLEPPMSWFCVRGRVVLKVEGQQRGNVQIEERFVVVKATDRKDAERRLARDWKMYAQPYLNSWGLAVRWQLIEIEDVYALHETEIRPEGTEVYSRFRTERMKPAYRYRLRTKPAAQPR